MKPQLIVVALTLAGTLYAADPTTGERLIAEERQHSQAMAVLEQLTDDIGPRLSGSEQAAAAVKWAVAQFHDWKIDVHTEPVMVPHWVRGAEEGHLVSQMNQKIVLTALGGSTATPDAGITADVVEVHNFDELTALGDKVRGKIVLFDATMDPQKIQSGHAFDAYSETVAYRGVGASRAAKQGAVASLVRSLASASLRTPHTGAVRYEEGVRIPAAAITSEDAALIHRLIARGKRVTMFLRLTPRFLPDAPSSNVIAEIKGTTKPEEIILIGGHLDSWDLGTGAIDDGSGVAMVMETMRLISAMGLQPKRTIRAVLFMNEENGLRGGKAYADTHKSEMENHVAAIETDAGAARPVGYITTLGAGGIEELRGQISELAALGAKRMESSKSTGADTSFLTDAGVAGFGFAPYDLHYFDYHHTPADTLDKIDPKELADDSAAIAVLAWSLANSAERLPLVKKQP